MISIVVTVVFLLALPLFGADGHTESRKSAKWWLQWRGMRGDAIEEGGGLCDFRLKHIENGWHHYCCPRRPKISLLCLPAFLLFAKRRSKGPYYPEIEKSRTFLTLWNSVVVTELCFFGTKSILNLVMDASGMYGGCQQQFSGGFLNPTTAAMIAAATVRADPYGKMMVMSFERQQGWWVK